jgi:hypothetical protein
VAPAGEVTENLPGQRMIRKEMRAGAWEVRFGARERLEKFHDFICRIFFCVSNLSRSQTHFGATLNSSRPQILRTTRAISVKYTPSES